MLTLYKVIGKLIDLVHVAVILPSQFQWPKTNEKKDNDSFLKKPHGDDSGCSLNIIKATVNHPLLFVIVWLLAEETLVNIRLLAHDENYQ